jgi:drug/metabolite transporter (DMT)-like permease
MLITVIFSLASALAFGSAVAAQQHVAGRLRVDETFQVRVIMRLVRNPLWTFGFVGEVIGFGLQLVALHHGALVVVQPLMTTSLVFAMVISVSASKAKLPASDWIALTVVVAGLIIFLLVAAPSVESTVNASVWRWLLTIGPMVAVIVWCLATGRRAQGTDRAIRLALASAAISAILVAFAKVFSDQISTKPLSILTMWSPYAIAAVGIGAVIVQQAAYQTARPTVTLPTIAALEPVLGVLLGVVVFDEFPRINATSVLVGGASLALLLGGIVKLARDAPHFAPHPAPIPPPSEPLGIASTGNG